MVAGSVVWIDEPLLAVLAFACHRDHGAHLRLPRGATPATLLAGPRRRYEAGERDPTRLAAAYFTAIADESSLGGGRALLAAAVALVFLSLNGHDVHVREDQLARMVRRFVRDRWSERRIAGWLACPV